MDRESLFSLELVVEKIYIPHVICRFPAVAFRLLDFPTILIEHVEADLSQKIKYKISRDPYYKVPPQFPELKDKQGNFLVRKGKSCLFKISTDTLKTHLTNTPMYVMVLDNYENVPKLIGNSTIPLDETMDEIVNDIKTMGNTVPSVHGDKGLFKVFSLMGKEIGYIILGYRLLSLGPGLIPHIPESAIAKRLSERNVIAVKPAEVESTPRLMRQPVSVKENLVSTQEMGSMTEPEKCDVLLQTVDMVDKEIHVAVGGPTEAAITDYTEEKMTKEYHTLATQTDKRRKQKSRHRDINALNIDIDSDVDEVIISDIVQPPSLFYNSKNEPKVKIQHQFAYDDDDSSVYTDDLVVENLSDEEEKKDLEKIVHHKEIKSESQKTVNQRNVNMPTPGVQVDPQNRPIRYQDLSNQLQNGPLFPMLTALLGELSCLQNPGFIQQTVRQVQAATRAQPQTRPAELQPVKTFVKPSVPAKVQKPAKPLIKDDTKKNIEQDSIANTSKGQKSVRVFAQPSEIVPKQKGWIRKAPEMGVKKSKLAYGLTNTQRLRLAKVNPQWLKTIEKEEMEAKALKQKPVVKPKQEEEFPTGEISDTLTEVRRLAQKNLNAEDTLAQSDLSTLKNTVKKNKALIKRGGRHSPLRKRSKSPKHKKYVGDGKKQSDRTSKLNDTDGYSPHADDERSDGDDNTQSGPSQKSIEVRIPSAQVYQDDSDYTGNESDTAPEIRRPQSKFPGFIDQNTSMPESIDGNVNCSLDEQDDDSPLESTRNEKDVRVVPEPKMFRSTDDYDTQLTEPELKNLLSSGERSVISDEMSSETGKSPSPILPSNSLVTAKFQVLNPKASLQSPIPALRKSNMKFENPGKASPLGTPRTPRSPSPVTASNSKMPTPRPRKLARERRYDFKHESIHTESVSSYVPSDNDDETYSDDFQGGATDDDIRSRLSTPELPRKLIPSTKLGYTIH